MTNPVRRLLASGAAALALSGLGLLLAAPSASADPVQPPVHIPINVCGNPGPAIHPPGTGNTCV